MQKFLTLLIIICVVIAAFVYYGTNKRSVSNLPSTSNQTESQASSPPVENAWLTYTNKNGYSISYPADWTVREYPGTGTGAGFQPKSLPTDPANEFITINISPKVGTAKSFQEYCRIAASNEIQGYQSLVSINPATASAGLVGYTTTWKVSGPGMMGKSRISEPITYFELPNFKPSSTLQVILNDTKYQDIYDSMLKSVTVK